MIGSMRKTAGALTLLAVSSTSVMAVEAVDLTVAGKLVAAACTPTLESDGTMDYGYINSSDIALDDYTVLSVHKLNLAIDCAAPAKFAIKAMSNRKGSTVSDRGEGSEGFALSPVRLFGYYPAIAGLGLAENGAKIGGYNIQLIATASHADSARVDNLVSKDGGSTWERSTKPNLTIGGSIVSWSNFGSITPIAMTNYTGRIESQAFINKGSELDLTQPITLDGSTTIEVVYL